MHLLNCFFFKLARDFYVVTLPTIVKIQDSPSPLSPSPRIRTSPNLNQIPGVGEAGSEEGSVEWPR